MSALVAFEVGEVFLKSPTFEGIMTELLERSQDPVDREVCADALVGNCPSWPIPCGGASPRDTCRRPC